MLVVQKRLAETLPKILTATIGGGNFLFIDSFNKRCDNTLIGTLLADKQDCGRSHYYVLVLKDYNNMEINESRQLTNIANYLKAHGIVVNTKKEIEEHLIGFTLPFIAKDPEDFTVKELALMTKRRKEIDEMLSKDDIPQRVAELLTLERKCYPIVRIRKLTPRECFRLMDVSEEDIDKLLTMAEKTKKGQQVLEQVLANSSLYHCAGNSIVVSCLFHIFRTLLVEEEKTNGVKAVAFRSEPKQLSLF